MKNSFFALIIFSLLFVSCTNEGTETPEEENFYALKVGNSWVYKNYLYQNSTDTYEVSGVIDSVKIVGNTEINGNTYFDLQTRTSGNNANVFYLNSNGESHLFVRDSLGYLITDSGAIVFLNNDYSERIVSDVTLPVTIFARLTEAIDNISTEAGSFECFDMEIYARNTDTGELLPGLDHQYYSDGLGLVYSTTSFVSTNYPIHIKRLDSYSIQ